MEEKKETFTYTYSAKEQEEIKAIRDKYVPQADGDTPMERLRRLDRSAARGATVVSLLVGIVSALLLGVGLCCTMLPGWESYFVLGRGRFGRRGRDVPALQAHDQEETGGTRAGSLAPVGRIDEVTQNARKMA